MVHHVPETSGCVESGEHGESPLTSLPMAKLPRELTPVPAVLPRAAPTQEVTPVPDVAEAFQPSRGDGGPRLGLSEFPPLPSELPRTWPRRRGGPVQKVTHTIDLDAEEAEPPDFCLSDDEDEMIAPVVPSMGEQEVDTDMDKAFMAGEVDPNEYVHEGLLNTHVVKRPLSSIAECKRKVMSAACGTSCTQTINLFSAVEQLHALPQAAEPEFYEVECTLDTGATVHAADRLDFPGYEIRDSVGSLAGQNFQAAGGKLIANEGEMTVHMLAPGGQAGELHSCFQVAKVTRPLLSVTKMTASGELNVLCKKDEALVLNKQGKVVARFGRNGGLYTCMMKVKNPRFQPFARPAR